MHCWERRFNEFLISPTFRLFCLLTSYFLSEGLFLVLSIIMEPIITTASMNQMPTLPLPLQAAYAWAARGNGS